MSPESELNPEDDSLEGWSTDAATILETRGFFGFLGKAQTYIKDEARAKQDQAFHNFVATAHDWLMKHDQVEYANWCAFQLKQLGQHELGKPRYIASSIKLATTKLAKAQRAWKDRDVRTAADKAVSSCTFFRNAILEDDENLRQQLLPQLQTAGELCIQANSLFGWDTENFEYHVIENYKDVGLEPPLESIHAHYTRRYWDIRRHRLGHIDPFEESYGVVSTGITQALVLKKYGAPDANIWLAEAAWDEVYNYAVDGKSLFITDALEIIAEQDGLETVEELKYQFTKTDYNRGLQELSLGGGGLRDARYAEYRALKLCEMGYLHEAAPLLEESINYQVGSASRGEFEIREFGIGIYCWEWLDYVKNHYLSVEFVELACSQVYQYALAYTEQLLWERNLERSLELYCLLKSQLDLANILATLNSNQKYLVNVAARYGLRSAYDWRQLYGQRESEFYQSRDAIEEELDIKFINITAYEDRLFQILKEHCIEAIKKTSV